MRTLPEIEADVEKLLPPQKKALLKFLIANLEECQNPPSPPHSADLMRFSGLLELAEDPVAWQRRLREEWA